MCYAMLRKFPFHIREITAGLRVNTSVTNNLHRYPEQMNCSEKHESSSAALPEEPTTCCMSGCANCVWIQYAEELAKVLQDGKKSQEVVMNKVTDPNMRAFLMTELKALKNVQENT